MTRMLLCITLILMLASLASCMDNGPVGPIYPVEPVEPVEPPPPPPPPPEPVLTVSIDDTYGDRFKPVAIAVSYTLEDEPIEWTYETSLRAERTDMGLLVYGDGSTYEGEVVINDSSFLVQLSSEPRCERVEVNTDCLGYTYRGAVDGQIYYGEEDAQIVEWELVILQYVGFCSIPSDVVGLCDDLTDVEDVALRLQKYNSAMENSGVHARFVLKDYRYVDTTSLLGGRAIVDYLGADIGIGLGATCPNTCGCAYAYATYSSPSFGWSVCGWDTDLHEMGHGLGLAHGPENSAYQATGYLFPQFGHGWMSNQCNSAGDLMSYNNYSNEFLNSKLTCDNGETYVTDRSYADSAYHLNRVRYDVSIVNDEHNEGTIEALRVAVPESGVLTID